MYFYKDFTDAKKFALITEGPEFKKLIMQVRVGSKKAFQKLIKHNRQLVHIIVSHSWMRTAKKSGIDPMDLVQSGTIGLMKATRSFRLGRGGNYKTYVMFAIQSYIESQLYSFSPYSRREGKRRRKKGLAVNPVISLSTPVFDNGDDGAITLEETLIEEKQQEDPIVVADVRKLLKILKKANGKINPHAYEIVLLRYGLGKYEGFGKMSLSETRKKLGNCLSTVGIMKIERRALNFMKANF